MSSSAYGGVGIVSKDIKIPMPDPKNYKILKAEQINKFLVLVIKYPNCTNYEGDKILVYEDVTINELTERSKKYGLDPHFFDDKKYLTPIARFEPTDKGWEYAIRFCKS